MGYSVKYIITFATLVCIVCGLFVSVSAVSLKDRQDANKVLDKQKKVLAVVGLLDEGNPKTPAEISKIFAENIKAKIVKLADGEYDDTIDLASFDQLKYSKDPATSKTAPAGNPAGVARIPNHAQVYHLVRGDKVEAIILPIEGKGLWSTLYGYIALKQKPDTNTIMGLTFYQHGETPGLGGEVDNPLWKAQWPGKLAFSMDEKTGAPTASPNITVVKGGAKPGDPYGIDGLSGATITARGVHHLVRFWLGDLGFGPYITQFRAEGK
jgi:Na+-transporting NADH:ubiquinone oxidoreductase subunit C